MAKNNLFTATETLQRAYQEIIDDESVTSRTNLYSSLMDFEKPSLSEILIDYYEPKNELFPSKQDTKKLTEIAKEKDKAIVDYIHTRLLRKQMLDAGFNDPDKYIAHFAKEMKESITEAGNQQFSIEEVDAMLEETISDNADSSNMTDEKRIISDSQNNLEPNKDSKR